MKKLLFILLIAISATTFAQGVAITSDGSAADASAQLDVQSTTKGFLPPRMSTAQKNAISSPATGLVVYDTDLNELSTYTGSGWTGKTTYAVGDFAQGGVVFWVDETGQRGLVAALEDQSTGVRWNAGTDGETRASGNGLFAGKANTSIIIAAHVAIGDDGSTYAARICNELIEPEVTYYGDWYLPSRDELKLMQVNKATIDATAVANGGSSFDASSGVYYWSSTEWSAANAWAVPFSTGGSYQRSKSANLHRVRAIRAF